MGRRERLERKLELREEWAERREDKAASLRAANAELRKCHAFVTQPGRIPERERANRRDEQAHEHENVAERHRSRAAGLSAQLERTIFSDDTDAVERLREKVAALEAERKRNNAINAAWRKAGKPDADCTEGWNAIARTLGVELETLFDVRRDMARDLMKRAPRPPYVNQNLGGRIRQARKRIEKIRADRQTIEAAESAGGVQIETAGDYCNVTFSEKPERSVIDALKEAGFRWSRPSWFGSRDNLPCCVFELSKGGI